MKTKSRCSLLILLSLLVMALTSMTASAAKPDPEVVHSAYKTYLAEVADEFENGFSYGYTFLDLNRDGVDELICYSIANRAFVRIVTFRSGKVKQILNEGGVTGLTYNSRKKMLYARYSSGAADSSNVIYSFNGKKLKKVKYTESRSRFKNGKMKVRYYVKGKKTTLKKYNQATASLLKKCKKWKEVPMGNGQMSFRG